MLIAIFFPPTASWPLTRPYLSFYSLGCSFPPRDQVANGPRSRKMSAPPFFFSRLSPPTRPPDPSSNSWAQMDSHSPLDMCSRHRDHLPTRRVFSASPNLGPTSPAGLAEAPQLLLGFPSNLRSVVDSCALFHMLPFSSFSPMSAEPPPRSPPTSSESVGVELLRVTMLAPLAPTSPKHIILK